MQGAVKKQQRFFHSPLCLSLIHILPTLAALYAIARLYPHAEPEEALAACMGPAAAKIALALLAMNMLYETAAVARMLMASSKMCIRDSGWRGG